MESHIGGPIMLSKYIQLTDEHKNDVETHQNEIANGEIKSLDPNPYKNKYSRKAAPKFYAYMYMENSNKSKYKSILKNLNQQNSF